MADSTAVRDRHPVAPDVAPVAPDVAQPELRWLIVAAGVVASCAFYLTAYGLFDFGWREAKVPREMAWTVPLAVDMLSLSSLAATYLFRHATWPVRAYAWGAFVLPLTVSVYANHADARVRGATGPGLVVASGWPLLLMVAAHLVVVARRYVDRQRRAAAAHEAYEREMEGRDDPAFRPKPGRYLYVAPPGVVQAETATSWEGWTDLGMTTDAEETPAEEPNAGDQRARARELIATGSSCRKAAEDVGVSAKTVERWTADIRSAKRTPAETGAES